MEESDLYAFKCKECDWIYLEPYNTLDRFATYPNCPNCGNDDVDMYDGELSEELQKVASDYWEELNKDRE